MLPLLVAYCELTRSLRSLVRGFYFYQSNNQITS